ncbi:MAG: TM0106 family RecB-like putative nuclease [Vicinamibacterales bacterium]
MRTTANGLVLAATDLSNFLACPHRSALDFAAALEQIAAPDSLLDAHTRLLRERGEAHERAYVQYLRNEGLNVVEVPQDGTLGSRVEATIAALASGADVVYQGAFAGQGWVGYADILRRVPSAPGSHSAFGDFQYEPYDTKLARETRGGTILQLALYVDLLGQAQGVVPERFFVVAPGAPFAIHEYRVADYAAYVRLVRRRMLEMLATGADALLARSYPEPVEHCDVCRWWERCNKQRRADDHLSFVASIGTSQRAELIAQGVITLAGAAALPVPVTFKPSRGSKETYDRIVEQAQVQFEQRTSGTPVVKTLPVVPGEGLCRLPEPRKADLFLDLEGARFVREGGHDYLFGLGQVNEAGEVTYRSWWAVDAFEEQHAFEQLIDAISAARAAEPGLHVYHFAPYEATAFKRLAGRYATRQDALDELLRDKCLVDLYAVVRQAVRAGVESYSIKELEQYYGYVRQTSLRVASTHRIAIEMALEARDPNAILADTRVIVEAYNREDVESTLYLRNWLEGLRSEQVESGIDVARPVAEEDVKKEATERTSAAIALRERLLDGVPFAASDAEHPDHVRWLLAYLIDWHHREEKAEWWEFFRLRELPEEDLFDEPKAIAGLQHVREMERFLSKKGKPTGSTIHRYQYPSQEVELGEGDKLRCQDDRPFGEVLALDRLARTLDVKRGKGADDHPAAAFSLDVVGTRSLQDSVMRFAERMLSSGFADLSACSDVLYRRSPRLRGDAFAPRKNESITDFAVRITSTLDRTTLAIQGPPGAGKTYVGARMIRAAVLAGKRVGVTASSHKVVQNLFDAVREQAAAAGEIVQLGRKPKDDEDLPPDVRPFKSNEAALAAVRARDVHVLGGTAWLWADEAATAAVDLLFVDEAGQFSLASTLAVAQAADSVVLLGDPQQLAQPQKATHPDGAEVSALAHVLGEHETMPPALGIFMPETWRLAPSVCDFTSELFYGGRLRPIQSLVNQRVIGAGGLDGAGLWWVPIRHDGNRSASDEEVEVVVNLVDHLMRAAWVDQNGNNRPLVPTDLRVVAPYNAQVNRLAARLEPLCVPVGTVDKFQGQTCAVVIYSMATSRPEDAPRGMEFLYSLNRLNVATSRARCAAFIVASPALVEPQSRTPRQMQLANGLCRFVELARVN